MKFSPPNGDLRVICSFIIAGGISSVTNVLSRIFLSIIMPFEIAVIIAYAIGMFVAFYLFKFFVFESTKRAVFGEGVRFSLVNVISLAQVWSTSVLLVRVVFPIVGFTWHAETVAHIIGLLSLLITSYALHRSYTFVNG